MAVLEKLRTNTLNDLLDWMDEKFEGDLPSIAVAAAEKAKQEGLVSGPLWDEIGSRTLHQVYRLQRIGAGRRQMTRLSVVEYDEQPISGNRAILYYIGGRYYNLLDMTIPELEEVAAHYNRLVESNGFERDYLMTIAGNLSEGQFVKDVFDVDSLKELRRDMVNN